MTALTKPTHGQIGRWSFGAGLALGVLHNPIWHVITALVPFI